jgi:hypothetical protein
MECGAWSVEQRLDFESERERKRVTVMYDEMNMICDEGRRCASHVCIRTRSSFIAHFVPFIIRQQSYHWILYYNIIISSYRSSEMIMVGLMISGNDKIIEPLKGKGL